MIEIEARRMSFEKKMMEQRMKKYENKKIEKELVRKYTTFHKLLDCGEPNLFEMKKKYTRSLVVS